MVPNKFVLHDDEDDAWACLSAKNIQDLENEKQMFKPVTQT